MQHNILFLFAYLNLELTRSKDLQSKVAAMRRKGVVFSKMFVLRSMGNELVPSPLIWVLKNFNKFIFFLFIYLFFFIYYYYFFFFGLFSSIPKLCQRRVSLYA